MRLDTIASSAGGPHDNQKAAAKPPRRRAGSRRRGSAPDRLGALIGHAVVKYHDTDVGFLCPLLPLPVFLEEDKGPDHDVLAAPRIGGRGRVEAGSMERPA